MGCAASTANVGDDDAMPPRRSKAGSVVEVTASEHNSTLVVIRNDVGVDEFIERVNQEMKSNLAGAVHVFFTLYEGGPLFLPVVQKHFPMFKFRQVLDLEHDGVLWVEHYAWCKPNAPDKVPEPFTSVLGVTVMLMDAKGSVLFVQEAGRFGDRKKFPGGAVDRGESQIDAARRELHEEIGIDPNTLDFSNSKLIGGYFRGNARPGLINDTFVCITAHINTTFDEALANAKPLDDEISKVSWVSREKAEEICKNIADYKHEYLDVSFRFVQSYFRGNGLPITVKDAGVRATNGHVIGATYRF